MLLNVLLSDSLKVYFELAHEPRVNISRNEIHWLKKCKLFLNVNGPDDADHIIEYFTCSTFNVANPYLR